MKSGKLASKKKFKKNKNKSLNIFNNIRSHYILQIVFDHLETDKTFNIVKIIERFYQIKKN